jgi:hypothetical protein
MRSDKSLGRRAMRTFTRLLPLLAVAIMPLGVAHAQGGAKGPAAPKAKQQKLRGEWQRAGSGFACQVHSQNKLTPGADMAVALARACQRMGPLGIGGDARTLKARLGDPFRTLPQPNDATAFAYFVETPGQLPYLVVTVHKDRIVALQITGPAAAKSFSFNGINLGDSTDSLTGRFGPPDGKQPSSLKDTEVWGYGRWPFTFEVKGGRVTSIRIHDPGS